MKVIIGGKQVDVGEALKTHIEESLQKNVKKYFENAIQANVTLTKEKPHLFKADIIVNEGTGTRSLIQSSAQDADAYKSFDQAVHKAERQLRKYKGRIKNHQKSTKIEMAEYSATHYVMSPFEDEAQASEQDANPVIIAENNSKIEKLSVGDAVMKMDLHQLNALLFINSSNNRANMVYYREDGNIAWVDAKVDE